MPASLIRAYEEGRRIPEWGRLVALASALSCTLGQLRPGQPTTLEDLRCAAGQNQAAAAAAAGLGRSGYAMLENGHTRTLKPEIARALAAAWGVSADDVVRAHAAAVQEAGSSAPVLLQGAVLNELAERFHMAPDALLELARHIQTKAEGRNT